jgi:small subunit ribosomal protein S9
MADENEVPETESPEVPQVETPSTLASGLTLGEGAPADETVSPDFKPVIRGKIDRFGAAMGTGRRKTSVARVRIKDGDGKLTINERDLSDYLPTERDQQMVLAPLKATGALGKVDVWVRVNGGGTTGQTGAIILGIARALQARDSSLHHRLAEGGYLTRDGRMVERKKYGFKKARRSFQFSKR